MKKITNIETTDIKNNTFNIIYTSRNKNPLYRNLINERLNNEEKVIALSSFITKILISCSKITCIENRRQFIEEIGLIKFTNAINSYVLYNDEKELEKCLKIIRQNFNEER